MNYEEKQREIKKTLRDIFSYLGIDEKNANNATVITYIEWLLDRVCGK